MSSSPSPKSDPASRPTKKVVIPKVWKRPHSTIYGKNVEFGSSLYSDKLGEINGRKFNSELPWHVRNSGSSSLSSSNSASTHQGYLSNLLNEPASTLIGSVIRATPMRDYNRGLGDDLNELYAPIRFSNSGGRLSNRCQSYADVLELTNPNRHTRGSGRRRAIMSGLGTELDADAADDYRAGPRSERFKIDFYDQYVDFSRDLDRINENSLLVREPLLVRRVFDNNLDFNADLGLFVPSYHLETPTTVSESSGYSPRSSCAYIRSKLNTNTNPLNFSYGGSGGGDDGRSLIGKRTLNKHFIVPPNSLVANHAHAGDDDRSCCSVHPATTTTTNSAANSNINPQHSHFSSSIVPINTTTQQTNLLPKHKCQLASSPYGPSADGRKLSLGSINPHSYRPSVPPKTSTVQASDGEEFEFQDRSSPFYTDR